MDDRTLIKEILDTYLPLVSRTSYRIMCDRKDSEIITERVMLSLLRKPGPFPCETEIMKGLLEKTCRSCRLRLFLRKVQQFLSYGPDVFVVSSPVVPLYDEYVARQAWQVFCRASSGFTDRQRTAYTLYELEQLPYDVVAGIVGISHNALIRDLDAARRLVGEELDHYGRIQDYDAYIGFIRKVEDQLTDKAGLQRKILSSLE